MVNVIFHDNAEAKRLSGEVISQKKIWSKGSPTSRFSLANVNDPDKVRHIAFKAKIDAATLGSTVPKIGYLDSFRYVFLKVRDKEGNEYYVLANLESLKRLGLDKEEIIKFAQNNNGDVTDLVNRQVTKLAIDHPVQDQANQTTIVSIVVEEPTKEPVPTAEEKPEEVVACPVVAKQEELPEVQPEVKPEINTSLTDVVIPQEIQEALNITKIDPVVQKTSKKANAIAFAGSALATAAFVGGLKHFNGLADVIPAINDQCSSEKAQEWLEKNKESISSLSSSLQQANEELTTLNTESDDAVEAFNSKSQELTDAKSAAAALKEQFDSADNAYQTAQMASLNPAGNVTLTDEQNASIEQLKSARDGLESQLTIAKDKIKNLENPESEYQTDLANHGNAIKTAAESVRVAKEKAEGLEADLSKAQEAVIPPVSGSGVWKNYNVTLDCVPGTETVNVSLSKGWGFLSEYLPYQKLDLTGCKKADDFGNMLCQVEGSEPISLNSHLESWVTKRLIVFSGASVVTLGCLYTTCMIGYNFFRNYDVTTRSEKKVQIAKGLGMAGATAASAWLASKYVASKYV